MFTKHIAPVFLCMLCMVAWLTPGLTQIVVVVNIDNPQDSLSLRELQQIFMADKTTWQSEDEKISPIILIDRKGNDPVAKKFFKIVCQLSHSRVRLRWMEKMLNGRMPGFPRKARNDQEVLRLVEKYPGAIGFVDASVFVSQKGAFKAVKIDGKDFSDREYRLK